MRGELEECDRVFVCECVGVFVYIVQIYVWRITTNEVIFEQEILLIS